LFKKILSWVPYLDEMMAHGGGEARRPTYVNRPAKDTYMCEETYSFEKSLSPLGSATRGLFCGGYVGLSS